MRFRSEAEAAHWSRAFAAALAEYDRFTLDAAASVADISLGYYRERCGDDAPGEVTVTDDMVAAASTSLLNDSWGFSPREGEGSIRRAIEAALRVRS